MKAIQELEIKLFYLRMHRKWDEIVTNLITLQNKIDEHKAKAKPDAAKDEGLSEEVKRNIAN